MQMQLLQHVLRMFIVCPAAPVQPLCIDLSIVHAAAAFPANRDQTHSLTDAVCGPALLLLVSAEFLSDERSSGTECAANRSGAFSFCERWKTKR